MEILKKEAPAGKLETSKSGGTDTLVNKDYTPEPPKNQYDPQAVKVVSNYQALDNAAKRDAMFLLNNPDQVPPPPADDWQPLGLLDAYAPLEPIRYVIEGLLEFETLNIFYGAPGSLKSFLLQDLALCVATGKPWLSPAPWGGGSAAIQTTQTPIMWLDFDMGKKRTLERFGALGRHYKAPSDAPIKIYSMPRPRLDAGDLVHIDLLIERCKGAGLIIIDNLRTISGGIDENSSQMSEVMDGLRELTERTGAAVVTIHHERKGSLYKGRAGEALRGHSSIEASIDLALQVDREPYSDIVNIKSTKTRGLEVLPFSAAFTFDKNPDKSLNTACFYGFESEDNESNNAIEREIKAALRAGPLNQSGLTAAVKANLENVGLNRISNQIKKMEAAAQIRVTIGGHNARIYSAVL